MLAKQFCVLPTTVSRRRFSASKMHLAPGAVGCCPFYDGGSVVVNLVFNVLPIVCGSSVFVFVLLCINLCPF